jgi:TPR repeat protein
MAKARIADLRREAEAGDAEAQNRLGVCYNEGDGVKQDYAIAVRWFREAAEQGHAAAQYELGVCYEHERGVRRDDTEAMRLYRLAANQGEMRAQFNLGWCYDVGMNGVERNYTKAEGWFREAAEQGHADAQYELGFFCESWDGVRRDDTEAVHWYRKAAEQGVAEAQYSLGLCYDHGRGVEPDEAEAVGWYREAAEQGHAEAQYNLGLCYYQGDGVKQDDAEAVRWFKLAAEQIHVFARDKLESLYGYGNRGRDEAEKARLYKLAAEQGHADAQCELGFCYYQGDGVRRDATEAARLYREAAEQEDAEAQFNLGWCYNQGDGVKRDGAKAAHWYGKAAEQGYANAQFKLGSCYEFGDNPAEAVGWYREAAEQGHVMAQFKLGLCYELGRGVRQNYTEAVRWYREAAEQGHDLAKECLKQAKFATILNQQLKAQENVVRDERSPSPKAGFALLDEVSDLSQAAIAALDADITQTVELLSSHREAIQALVANEKELFGLAMHKKNLDREQQALLAAFKQNPASESYYFEIINGLTGAYESGKIIKHGDIRPDKLGVMGYAGKVTSFLASVVPVFGGAVNVIAKVLEKVDMVQQIGKISRLAELAPSGREMDAIAMNVAHYFVCHGRYNNAEDDLAKMISAGLSGKIARGQVASQLIKIVTGVLVNLADPSPGAMLAPSSQLVAPAASPGSAPDHSAELEQAKQERQKLMQQVEEQSRQMAELMRLNAEHRNEMERMRRQLPSSPESSGVTFSAGDMHRMQVARTPHEAVMIASAVISPVADVANAALCQGANNREELESVKANQEYVSRRFQQERQRNKDSGCCAMM